MIDRLPPFEAREGSPAARGRETGQDAAGFAEWIGRGASGPPLPVLADGAPPPESAYPLPDQARVFNEDGFFAGTLTVPETRSAAMHASQADGPVALDLAGQGLAPDGARAPQRPAPGRHVTPVASNVPTAPPVHGRAASVAHDDPSPPALDLSPADVPVLMETEAVAASPAMAPARSAAAQSALRIAIRDIERGLQILVVAQQLSAEERERLANEIAALLSRHGLVPRDVQVASAAPRASSGRG
jgi:hypothetical protein